MGRGKVKVVKHGKTFLQSLKELPSRFSRGEVYSIVIAWLVLSFAFAYLLWPKNNLLSFIVYFLAALVAVAFGFIMHELMHKFTAQKYRYHAEFQLWPMGLLLALVTAFIGFLFAAPGATVFQPDPSEPYIDPKGFTKRYGEISAAGPRINIIFGFIFLAIFYGIVAVYTGANAQLFDALLLIIGLTSFINFYLAAFNMLPLGSVGGLGLDGYKVWRWDKLYWITLFAIPAVMSVLIIFGVLPYLNLFI